MSLESCQKQACGLQAQALLEQESTLSQLRMLESTVHAEDSQGDDSDKRKSLQETIRAIISTQESAARLLMLASQAQLNAMTAVQELPQPPIPPPMPPALPPQAPVPPYMQPPPPMVPPAGQYAAPDPNAAAAPYPYAYAPSMYAPVPPSAPQPPPYDAYGAYSPLEPSAKRQHYSEPPKNDLATRVIAKPASAGRYKIVQCRNWMTTGQCRFGDQCTYAHGTEEQSVHRYSAGLVPGYPSTPG